MSLPQVQYQLGCRPVLLAGGTWALLNGRPITTASRPVAFAAFSDPLDVSHPSVVGGNLVFSVSTTVSRNAFLGHSSVSPLGVEGHSTPIGSDDVQNLFAGSANGHG